MTNQELKNRFKAFAVSVVQFAMTLPDDRPDYRNIRGQMIRSGTSSAANYRAALRGRSTAEFLAKMGIVEEETDETLFWLEFLVALSEEWRPKIASIWKEGDQLLAIVVSTIRSTKANHQK